MTIGYSAACLIGAMMEALFYGLYFTFFLQSLQVLQKRLVGGPTYFYLAGTAILLFILITMRLVFDLSANVTAFTYDPITPHAADIYLQKFGTGALLRTGTYVGLTIVADIFIVYRVWAVWSRNIWISLVPAGLAVADIVTGALFLDALEQLEAGGNPDSQKVATRAIIFYSFTLALNVICSLLISFQLYLGLRRAKAAQMSSSMNLAKLITIIIESASLYSACLIAMIVPTALGSNVQFCVLSIMPSVIGLAFSLIIVRVGSGMQPTQTYLDTSSLDFGTASGMQFAQTGTGTGTVGSRPTNASTHVTGTTHVASTNLDGGASDDGKSTNGSGRRGSGEKEA